MGESNIAICDGKIINGELTGIKKSVKNPSYVTAEEFETLIADFKDCLFWVQGDGSYSHDDSDDERAGCDARCYGFSRYFEIEPWENSKYFLRIDGKIRGIVFHITSGNNVEYYPFLFDNSIKKTLRMGYSASHSSCFTYIEKVSVVKRGEDGAPKEGRSLRFAQNEMYPSF